MPRWVGAAAAVIITGLCLSATVPAPAQATDFRYWGYWLSVPDAGDWAFASLGPAFRAAVDGSVEGWRFAATGVAADAPPRSRPGAVFRAACGDTAVVEGSIRVAVVIDPGSTGDAPPDQEPAEMASVCVVLPAGATGMDALAAAAVIRIERGLVCGINGYPEGECVEPVADEPEPIVEDAAGATSSAQPRDLTAVPTPSPAVDTASPAVTQSPSPAPAASRTDEPAPISGADGQPSADAPRVVPSGPGPWPLVGAGLIGLTVAAYALIRRRAR